MGTSSRRVRGSGGVGNKEWTSRRCIFFHGVKFLRLLCMLVV